MQDGVDGIVEQFAVVADDQRGMRIFLEPRFEPQRAFEVEIVGRFVEEQHVGLGEQRCRQRDAHAPAAGELRHRTMQVGLGETEPAEDFSGSRRCAVGVDFVEPRIDFRELFGLGGFELGIERFALRVGGEDRVDEADRRGRMLLVHRRDPRRLRQQDLAAQGHEIAEDDLEQRRFADPVAADQPDLGSGRNRHGRGIEEPPSPGVKNEILDPKHRAASQKEFVVGRKRPLFNAPRAG